MRSMLERRSPSPTLMSLTPWVLRLSTEIPATVVRTRVPPTVMSMISSSGLTRTAPTCSPLRSEQLMDSTPLPPRPLVGKSSTGVRLP